MQVVEVELAKEYALRVKELAGQEQQAASVAAHTKELQEERQRRQDLQTEMENSLAARDRQTQQADEKQQVCRLSAQRDLQSNFKEETRP